MTVAEKEHDWKNGTCSECGYICTHTGGTATCTAKAVCTICKQPYGEVDSNNHAGEEKWTQTEEKHEKKWNCCNLVIVKKEVHEWKDGACEECGYACQHKDDNNDHSCDVCSKKISDHIGGKATCIAKAVCTTCGQTYGEVDSSNHTGKEEWIQTEEKHEKKWNCCNLVTVAGEEHEWKDGVCEECKYVCQHKDDNNDHLCDICDKKVSDHIGGIATCTAKAVCTTCGQSYGEIDSSNHTGKKEWIQTEEKHEKKWNCCNLVIVKKEVHEWKDGACEECKYVCQHKDDNNDHLCDICSKKISDHTGGTATCTEKAVCTTCGQKYGEVKNHDILHHEAKAATCTEIGWEAYDTCKREGCTYSTYKEIAALNHDLEYHKAKAATCTESGYEAYWKCSKCAKLFSDEAGTHEISKPVEINASGHDLKKVEKKAPTCTEIGWEAYDTCSHCNYTTYMELPKLNHDLEHHEAQAATCTEIGWEAYDTCKREGCNYSTYKELPALKHDLEHHEAKAATCTENGWDAYDICKRDGCKYTTYKELPALNHDLEHHEAKAATCTEIGWEAYDTCKREGCTYSTYNEIAALEHDLEHHEAKAATCTEIGWNAYDTCKREGCTYSTYKELPALNHDLDHHEAKAATCKEIGWDAYDTCKREGCTYSTYVELPKLNHDLEHHEAKAATCKEIGWDAYDTCKREGCNYSTYKEIAALNHDLEHHEAQAATCTEIGWEAYDTCKREGCTYSTYKELPALNHDLEHHEAKAATCTEIGWEAYDTCKREGCKYSTYKEIAALDHDLEHHEAKAATCTEIGWEAYDTCKREGCKYTTYKELPALGHEDSNNDHFCDACSTKISDHSYESKIAREATTTYTGIRIYTCTKCGHSYTEELAKLPSQTNQADQTNQIEPANNGNEKDFIGTVTSVFLNVTDFAAKNFRISFWLMIQMLLKAVMQLW